MKHAFSRTLTGQTLWRLALGGALVLLLTSLLGTYVLFRQTEAEATSRLMLRVQERARQAERVLEHSAETHETVRNAFVSQWPQYQDAATLRRFDALMTRYPDGAWRNRREIADGRIHPTGWIARSAALNDDLRRRVVLFYDLSKHFGPGAALRHDNLFFVGLPEEANMGFDPYLYPNWIFDIGEDFTQLHYEWGRLAYEQAAPGAPTRWSMAEIDEVGSTLGPVYTAVTPIHVDGRHVAAVASTLLLNDFLARVLPPHGSEGRYLLFHADGRLLADTAMGERLSRQVGTYRLDQLDGDLPGLLAQAARKAATGHPQSGYGAQSDAYFAVSLIHGPQWYIAAAQPGTLVRDQARGPVLWAAGAGMGVLLSLLALFGLVLRRHVAAPLGELTRAAERVAGGDTGVRLPTTREDELGRLATAFNDMTDKVAQRDATLREDKRRIEEALTSLRLTEERWRAMTENASDVIAVVDARGVFSYVSPPAERMLGHPVDALVGSPARALMHPDDAAELGPRLERPLGKPVQCRARHANGQWRTLEVAASDLRHHPAIQGLVLNVRDVSETLAAEETLARQREALHQSEKLTALGSLLAGVAHELNNPLAVVVGRSIQLESAARSSTERETAGRIRQAAERCARIVKTFLAMARRQDVTRAPTSVNRVITDALEVLAYTLDSSGISVHAALADDLPPVLADADQLGQVFMNLFTNAQQAMSGQAGRRELQVSTHRAAGGHEVQVVVQDSGPGIAPELGARIFEPFFTTKAVGDGTGVGLSVSLGIVQSHGGSMLLAPHAPNRGARFVVSLPAHAPAAAPSLPATAPAATPSAGGPWRVLIVDDEIDIAEILGEIVQHAGHAAVLANSGEQALAQLAAQPFDLVMTDLKMPGMDGPALYRDIEHRHPALARRVIVVTGDTLSSGAHEFLREVRVPVIDKPFTPDEVLACIAAVMR
ncbi:ATP-binding protein [Piscinibacter sp.]|uniref:ATP-binding protein n=1 Tax=Piscinibacter sp. TaxID=1903157 RepID=UPI0039E3AAC7